MIDTVIFDIGNVLAPFNWEETYRRLFDGQTLRKVAAATIYNGDMWKEVDRGIKTEEELIAAFVEGCPELEAEIRLGYREIYKNIRPAPYATAWVRNLKKRGLRVYILSNYGREPFEESKKQFDFLNYTDGAVISYEVHKIKPEREIYDILCSRYAIEPARAAFIDDVAENVLAARDFGLNAIQFTTKNMADAELERYFK